MRVTSLMITGQVVFNMQRSISRMLEMQSSLSSGRRIERPSDDPTGTLRDLSYRAELARNEQYLKNISRARSWTGNYDTILADLKDLLSTTKELAIGMANGTFDAQARSATATEIRSILDQVIRLANNSLEGVNVFSGFKTTTKALTATASGAVYNGDQGLIEFPIEAGSRTAVNLNGADVFLKSFSILGADADLNVGVTAATLLADLNNGSGIDLASGQFTITDQNLGITSTVDISGATTVNDAINAINAQLAADGITNLSAVLGGQGNNIILDIDDSMPRLITDGTLVVNLNDGRGVDMTTGKIRLTDNAAIDIEIDLTGATTIGDIRAAFNAQVAAQGVPLSNLTMQINGAGTGLEIVDGNIPVADIQITEVNPDSQTAIDLGILGSVGALLTGIDLNPAYSFNVVEAGGTTAADIGLSGSFTSDRVGSDLNPLLLATNNLADLNNGLGFIKHQIIVGQGNSRITLDLTDTALITVQDVIDLFNNSGLDITASINAGGSGIQVVNNDPYASLVIEDTATGRLAKDWGLFGSSDMMGSLSVLVNVLENNDQEGTGMLLDNLDKAINHLLNFRGAVGSRAARLITTQSRLFDLKLTFTGLLSEVEDADITKVLTDLATFEANYQASMLAGARIIQPSLLNFLK